MTSFKTPLLLIGGLELGSDPNPHLGIANPGLAEGRCFVCLFVVCFNKEKKQVVWVWRKKAEGTKERSRTGLVREKVDFLVGSESSDALGGFLSGVLLLLLTPGVWSIWKKFFFFLLGELCK